MMKKIYEKKLNARVQKWFSAVGTLLLLVFLKCLVQRQGPNPL